MPAVPSSPAATAVEKTGPATLGTAEVDSPADAFAAVPDPRAPRGRWHPLVAILLIAACAVTGDADGFTAIWQWADDAPPPVLARLRVRVDPWSGAYRAPSERTIFDEDHCQARTGHAPRNLATLRNLAIDTCRAHGHANIAHARRYYAHRYDRVLDLYRL